MALIQEPWTFRGRIKGLNVNGGRLIYCTFSARPRAGVLTRDKTAIPLWEHCGADLAAIEVTIGNAGHRKELVMASVYMPYDSADPLPAQAVTELVEDCWKKGWELILVCDANAHHTVWGSSNTNRRGRELLEFLGGRNLDLLNRGRAPTFANSIRRKVIDLTLGSSGICNSVRNWRVSDEPSLSDHRHITFTVREGTLRREVTFFRNPRCTNWSSFAADLGGRLRSFPSRYGSPGEIDIATNVLRKAIIAAYEENCPLKRRCDRDVKWWSADLQNLRRRARRAINRAKKIESPEASEEARVAQREYRKATKRGKRQSWRKFLGGVKQHTGGSPTEKNSGQGRSIWHGSFSETRRKFHYVMGRRDDHPARQTFPGM